MKPQVEERMDPAQAEAAADALLQPAQQHQQTRRRQLDLEYTRQQAYRRRSKWALAFACIGAAIGYFGFGRLGLGCVIGAWAGAVASAWIDWSRRQR